MVPLIYWLVFYGFGAAITGYLTGFVWGRFRRDTQKYWKAGK